MNKLLPLLFSTLTLLGFQPAFAAENAPPLPEIPAPVTSFGAAVSDEWLYMYGGNLGKAHEFNRDCVRGDFFRLKLPDGAAWETLPGGQGLLSCSMVPWRGGVIRVGGMNAANARGEKNDLHSTDEVMRFAPAKGSWELFAKLPEPRSSHDAAVLNDKLFVGGGWNLNGKSSDDDDADGSSNGQWSKTLLSLDLLAPEKGWQSIPQPFARRALAAAAYGGRIWFMGGIDNVDELSSKVDWYDPETGQWGKGPDLPKGPMAGFGMAACVQNGRLFISPFSGKIFALSVDESHWESAGALDPTRFFHHLLPFGGKLVALGGSNNKGHVKELEVLATSSLISSADAAAKAVSSPPTASWPQWRGMDRDGVSSETGWKKDWPENGPPLLWRAHVGLGISSCVVDHDRVFAQGNDGNGKDSVYALDAASGETRWTYSFPCPTAAHEMQIVPNGPGATPTISDGSVYALSREGDLLCLDEQSGKLQWQKSLIKDLGGKRPVYGYTQSPLIDHGHLFLDVGSEPEKTGSTVALDPKSGAVLWKAGSGEAGYSSARAFDHDGKRYIAMFKGEELDVFDPEDGRVAWSHRTTVTDFCNALTPVFVGSSVLVSNTGSDPAKLLTWESGGAANVHEAWEQRQFALMFNNAIYHDNSLFGFNEKRSGKSEFVCLDAATGEARWTSTEVPIGTFILADQHWIFLTRTGDVMLAPASASGLKPIARSKASVTLHRLWPADGSLSETTRERSRRSIRAATRSKRRKKEKAADGRLMPSISS